MNITIEKPIRIAMFTFKERYSISSTRHRMNPETVSALEGYLKTVFPRQITFKHIDSYYVNPENFLKERFDIVGLNVHWRDISPVTKALKTWPLNKMAKHIFIEGSFINSLKDGHNVLANQLRETGINAFLVYGEPEPAVEGLIENIIKGRPLDTIPNLLGYKDSWQNITGFKRTDLSKISTQPYQYLEKLLAFPLHTFHVETSRGCYYGACSFCTDAKIWGKGWRGYPIENVISLFEDMRNNKVDYAFIFDKDFWGNELERAKSLATALIKSGNSIPYLVALRADEIINGEYLLESFKKSGLAFVFLGAETFSQSIARRYNKGISVKETLKAIEILKKHQIDFGLGYIIDPLASMKELIENLKLIKKYRLWGHISSIFNAMEVRSGTGYETLLKKLNLLRERDNNNLLYHYEFADPQVAKIVEISKEWLSEIPHFNVYLLLAKRVSHKVKGREQQEHSKYNRYYRALQKIDFDFLFNLAKLISQKKENEIQKLRKEMTQLYNQTVQKLQQELNPTDVVSNTLLRIVKGEE